MKDILQYLIEMLEPLGYPGIVAFLAAISAGCGSIVKLVAKLQTLYRQRKLNRYLFPLYTAVEFYAEICDVL